VTLSRQNTLVKLGKRGKISNAFNTFRIFSPLRREPYIANIARDWSNVSESQTSTCIPPTSHVPFFRSAPPIMADSKHLTAPHSPRAISAYGLVEECLTIVLTSEIGRGATGVVHRGTLKPEISDGSVLLDVIVKLAFDDDQRDSLRNEYEVYRCLRSKGVQKGIAIALGIFDDSECDPCALVMLYAGVSLATEPERVLSVSERSVS
jgi:hypothetical protein